MRGPWRGSKRIDVDLEIRDVVMRMEALHQADLPEAGQRAEMARCEGDMVHWVNTYCLTYDPRELGRPVMPFHLFPRQAQFLLWLGERQALRKSGLAEKSRDVGFTWLCCAYALHGWLFQPGYAAGFGSRVRKSVENGDDPSSIFWKLRFLLDHLPAWMRPRGFVRHKHCGSGRLANPVTGASIIGEGGAQIGRGGRTSMYFLDEAAFLAQPALADAALSANSDVKIYVSTPNGIGGRFYEKRFGGAFDVFTFHWRDDPRKTDAWYEAKLAELGPTIVAQEIDIDYGASVEGICIPAKWVRAAVGLELRRCGPLIAGLDIADEGANKTVFIPRQGPVVLDPESWNSNTTATAHKAAELARAAGVKTLFYDCSGGSVGAGVKGTWASSERPLGFDDVPVVPADDPSSTSWPDGRSSKQKFRNLRAEMWWKLRTRFEKTWERVENGVAWPDEECISIPNHSQLIAELSQPKAFYTESGKIQIESKPDLARRGIKSPDHADALTYTEAGDRGRVEVARSLYG